MIDKILEDGSLVEIQIFRKVGPQTELRWIVDLRALPAEFMITTYQGPPGKTVAIGGTPFVLTNESFPTYVELIVALAAVLGVRYTDAVLNILERHEALPLPPYAPLKVRRAIVRQ